MTVTCAQPQLFAFITVTVKSQNSSW